MYLKIECLEVKFQTYNESFVITQMKGITPNLLVLLVSAKATLIPPGSSQPSSDPWVKVAANILSHNAEWVGGLKAFISSTHKQIHSAA